MRTILFYLTVFFTSFLFTIAKANATSAIYVAAEGGILKCDINFKGCNSATPSQLANLNYPSYIAGIYQNRLYTILDNIPYQCQINSDANLSCTPINEDLGISMVIGAKYYELNNILYVNVNRAVADSLQINYINNIYPPQQTPTITAFIPESVENLNYMYPILQDGVNQIAYGVSLSNNTIYELVLNVNPSSFGGCNSNPYCNDYKPPFTNTTPLVESYVPINMDGLTLVDFNGMVIVKGNSQNYLYLIGNFNVETCAISSDYLNLSNCNSKLLIQNPLNIYFNPNKYALDILYNDHIDEYPIVSSTGKLLTPVEVMRKANITSLAYYFTPN